MICMRLDDNSVVSRVVKKVEGYDHLVLEEALEINTKKTSFYVQPKEVFLLSSLPSFLHSFIHSSLLGLSPYPTIASSMVF